ncbi:MAG: Uma2 family endonuclease [Pseudomonadota bacterium]
MSEAIELDEETLINEEESDMGSWAHSSIQASLACLLRTDGRFNVLTELNLDVSQVDLSQFGIHKDEIKPDVCLYAKKKRVEPTRDLIRMLEYPLTAIEILSPKQNISELSAKLNAYFALGVKSYWLVLPMNESITVYSSPTQFELFGTKDTEVIDEVMDIRLPIKEIFDLYLD